MKVQGSARVKQADFEPLATLLGEMEAGGSGVVLAGTVTASAIRCFTLKRRHGKKRLGRRPQTTARICLFCGGKCARLWRQDWSRTELSMHRLSCDRAKMDALIQCAEVRAFYRLPPLQGGPT